MTARLPVPNTTTVAYAHTALARAAAQITFYEGRLAAGAATAHLHQHYTDMLAYWQRRQQYWLGEVTRRQQESA